MFTRVLPGFLLASVLFIAACESTGVDLDALSGEAQAALDILPPDALVVGMLDVHDLSNDADLPWISTAEAVDELEGEARAYVQDFLTSTGFNPDEDLTSVFVAIGSEGRDAVIVANASYEMSRVVSFLDANIREATKSAYRDYVIYELEGDGKTGAVGLSGESTIVAGPSRAAIESAFDRFIDKTPGLSSNVQVMNLVRKVSASPAWLVSSDIESWTLPVEAGDSEFAAMLTAVSAVAVGMEPTSDEITVTAFFTPGNGLQPSELADLAKGAVALLKVEAKDDPEAFAILDDISIKESSSDVRVRVAVTKDMLAQHIDH